LLLKQDTVTKETTIANNISISYFNISCNYTLNGFEAVTESEIVWCFLLLSDFFLVLTHANKKSGHIRALGHLGAYCVFDYVVTVSI